MQYMALAKNVISLTNVGICALISTPCMLLNSIVSTIRLPFVIDHLAANLRPLSAGRRDAAFLNRALAATERKKGKKGPLALASDRRAA